MTKDDDRDRIDLLEDALYADHQARERAPVAWDKQDRVFCACKFCEAYRDRRPLMREQDPADAADRLGRRMGV